MTHHLEHLRLERPLVGVDLETTGTDPRKDGIVELGLEVFAPGKPVYEYRTYVNPMMPIPPAATAKHHITDRMVQSCRLCGQLRDTHEAVVDDEQPVHEFKPWPTFRQLAESLVEGLTDCDFIGYNVRFDLRQLAEEFTRAAVPWSYADAKVICAYRLWQITEGRSLTHYARRYGVKLDGDAHTALHDIKTTTRGFAAALREHQELPRAVDQLHELCWPDWYDADGKLRWDDAGELTITFGEHKGQPLRLIRRDYLKWMLKKDFSAQVKRAIEAEIAGKAIRKGPPCSPDASSSQPF